MMGKLLARGTVLIRTRKFQVYAVLLILVWLLGHRIIGGPTPWDTDWPERAARGEAPSTGDRIKAMTWVSCIVNLVLTALLLASSKWWLKFGDVTPRVRMPRSRITQPWFWGLLALLLAVSLWVRLPRMDHSMWGDEERSFSQHVHGKFVPADANDPLGPLVFKPARWRNTFFYDKAYNHYVFSIVQRLYVEAHRKITGSERYEFSEAVSRTPVLVVGLASLVVVAILAARMGYPGVGLLAALLMSLHPWHIRYCTDGRGYAFVWLFLILLFWAAINFLERGRWRDGALLALAQFLMLYTWKALLYPLLMFNAGLVFVMFKSRRETDRSLMLQRWLIPSIAAAAAFVQLVLPNVPQFTRQMKLDFYTGRPMDLHWLGEALSAIGTGMDSSWHQPGNPLLITLMVRFEQAPAVTTLALALSYGLAITGGLMLWRKNRLVAFLMASILLGSLLNAVHYKIIGKEYMRWYFSPLLPCGAYCAAIALTALGKWLSNKKWLRLSAPAAVAALAALTMVPYLLCVAPFIDILLKYPLEDLRGMSKLTRPNEGRYYQGPTDTITCHLWRGSWLYDPRIDYYVRTAEELEETIEFARQHGKKFAFAVGHISFCEVMHQDILQILRDQSRFEYLGEFWGFDPVCLAQVYQLKP